MHLAIQVSIHCSTLHQYIHILYIFILLSFIYITIHLYDSVLDGYSRHTEIDSLIVLDRDVDLVSPLITPLTYEGDTSVYRWIVDRVGVVDDC